MSDITRDDFGHWAQVPVRWGDVDRLGHVNNVQYFRYSEEARTQWIAAMTSDMADVWGGGQGPILAAIDCEFILQLRHPNTVEVGTRVVRIGTSSLQMQQGFFVLGETKPVAASTSRVVWFDYEQQRSAPVPEAMRKRVRSSQPQPPEE